MWQSGIKMNQKLEDILNLALETPQEIREQTETLNVGFDGESRTWELIVKYHGSLERLAGLALALLASAEAAEVLSGLRDNVAVQLENDPASWLTTDGDIEEDAWAAHS